MRLKLFMWCVAICCVFSFIARAQEDAVPKTIGDSVGRTLKWTEYQFSSVAEAMPEAKYNFIPNSGNFEGVRSFAEQVKHVACANYAFFNEIEAKAPPEACERGGPSTARSKAELLKYLRESFDYGNGVLEKIDAKNALERAEGRYGGPNTKLGLAVTAVWHITDHYGQLVVYLRLNNIVPPTTQKFGLKVR